MFPPLSKNLKRKRIVVIDDQGSMRSVFQAYLREMGFSEIVTVIDGEEGIKTLENIQADMVICDWNMPKVSGLEVLQTLRACEATKTLPFIMVTSSSELARVKEAASHGVSDYLIKPFQPLTLGQKVIELLSESTHKPRVLKRLRTDLTLDGDDTDAEESDDELMVENILGKQDTD